MKTTRFQQSRKTTTRHDLSIRCPVPLVPPTRAGVRPRADQSEQPWPGNGLRRDRQGADGNQFRRSNLVWPFGELADQVICTVCISTLHHRLAWHLESVCAGWPWTNRNTRRLRSGQHRNYKGCCLGFCSCGRRGNPGLQSNPWNRAIGAIHLHDTDRLARHTGRNRKHATVLARADRWVTEPSAHCRIAIIHGDELAESWSTSLGDGSRW